MDNQIIQDVKTLIDEVQKTHRYSMSRIYALHNQVFGKDEAPQSCASCLIRKINDLKKWLSGFDSRQANQAPKVETTANAEAKPQAVKRARKKKGA